MLAAAGGGGQVKAGSEARPTVCGDKAHCARPFPGGAGGILHSRCCFHHGSQVKLASFFPGSVRAFDAAASI